MYHITDYNKIGANVASENRKDVLSNQIEPLLFSTQNHTQHFNDLINLMLQLFAPDPNGDNIVLSTTRNIILTIQRAGLRADTWERLQNIYTRSVVNKIKF
jgi:hypothetical protein